VLGPIQQVTAPADVVVAADPIDQEQQSEQAKKDSDKSEDSDDGSVDVALGLINTGPVQLKTELEEPVTSGGMNTMIEDPGITD
jgi:hypothetical protein